MPGASQLLCRAEHECSNSDLIAEKWLKARGPREIAEPHAKI
jgi:hypothetical protein